MNRMGKVGARPNLFRLTVSLPDGKALYTRLSKPKAPRPNFSDRRATR